jgi:hypothetical protein
MRRKCFFRFLKRPENKNLTKKNVAETSGNVYRWTQFYLLMPNMIFLLSKGWILVYETSEKFTIYTKMTELGACFAIFDQKTVTFPNVLIDSGTEKNSASNEVTPVPPKCHFHRGLGKKLVFQAETK